MVDDSRLGSVCDLKPGDLFWSFDLNVVNVYVLCVWNVPCETKRFNIDVPGNRIGFIAENVLHERTFHAAKETCFP